jgi:hypothetical protein
MDTPSAVKHRPKHPPRGATRETRVTATTTKAEILKRAKAMMAAGERGRTKAMKAMTTEKPVTLPTAPWDRPEFKSVRGKDKK